MTRNEEPYVLRVQIAVEVDVIDFEPEQWVAEKLLEFLILANV